ncbi:bifunctional glutamate N-acetyltransferase/amino-acid acetyltransferase ArgJ [Virgibacillus ndiopensis]|uniref:bifunctional glutamate N-acetyltransferase/amino-acid acetyltransferase ArgJ n=1 Tax=Virgibacillus ndiopensis TaxID=2004408 RepID=UPI000C06F6BD|nr:bifunctional glutamate N-acetyltransferase/amino-acid acetyltransferase ArgJ [Virgibacillus ndiopensis]
MLTIDKQITKKEEGSIVTPAGFQATGIHSGVKRKRNDLGIITCDVPANAAAVYTTNVIQAAPLRVTKESIAKDGKIQAVIVNSGNANACTGKQGEKDAYQMRSVTAKQFLLPEHYVAVASTGIIGQVMPMDKIIPSIKRLKPDATDYSVYQFNESVLTTDVSTKSTCYQTTIDGKKVTMAGSAKGSGMIEPNMATMLAFVTTDAVIESDMLQLALNEVTDKTFNCITVDGDTSTNDMVLVMASEKTGHESLTPEHREWDVFVELLRKTCEDLAKMIARDGEGATTLIEVEVNGARNDSEANQVAKSVVGSSLVKTAVYGADANWGRIIAAVGYSKVAVDVNTIDIAVGSVKLLEDSQPLPFVEEEVSRILENETVKIRIDLKLGKGIGKAWGCDLTYDYVRINASYRS